MTQEFNIYCDESSHLEHDGSEVMVLGAVWCPRNKTRQISVRIRELKQKHGLGPFFEVKWTKVSPGGIDLYMDLVDYFFDNNDLHFRALVIPEKSKLAHEAFNQHHDDWYYKMQFDMLKVIFDPEASYRIYLDVKDTRSAQKVVKLHDVLCNNMYDFSREIIQTVQSVRSHEVELLQLADLLIGAVAYANQQRTSSTAKVKLVERLRRRSGYSLLRTTLYQEDKVNILRWSASEADL